MVQLTSSFALLAAFAASSVAAHSNSGAAAPHRMALVGREMDEDAHLLLDKRAAKTRVYTACTKPGQVALTFDDGPYSEKNVTAQVKAYGGIATFFTNGNNYDCAYNRYGSMREAFSAGMQFGSHTYSHPDAATLTDAQFDDELAKNEVVMKKILGIKPALFRFPFGSYKEANLPVLAKRGYIAAVNWDQSTEDADGETVAYSKKVIDDIVKLGKTKNALLLQHETIPTTIKTVLPYALQKLSKAGFKFVSVTQCLGLPDSAAYQSKTASFPKKDKTWVCPPV